MALPSLPTSWRISCTTGDRVTVLTQMRPASAAQDAACGYAVEQVEFGGLGERRPLALLSSAANS